MRKVLISTVKQEIQQIYEQKHTELNHMETHYDVDDMQIRALPPCHAVGIATITIKIKMAPKYEEIMKRMRKRSSSLKTVHDIFSSMN